MIKKLQNAVIAAFVITICWHLLYNWGEQSARFVSIILGWLLYDVGKFFWKKLRK